MEPSSSLPTVLDQYASFPFSVDDEYQSGLDSLIAGGVLANDPPEDIKQEIFRRTRVFYFNRVTGQDLSIDAVREYELSLLPAQAQAPVSEAQAPQDDIVSPPHEAVTTDPSEPVVLTFAQLKALIEAGKEDEIPNNKIIPEGLNEQSPSVSSAPVRRKPWEAETVSVS
ncbi:hypothetical protein C8F01DRAFT_1152789 [Mycena amicta]|nr:hypothetical protein C8F01DRAFT_1152789 [Mycena amicta]